MIQKPAKVFFQTECRHPEQAKAWREDDSCAIFREREDAIQDALQECNENPGWQYRVVKFTRDLVEVYK